MTVLVVGGGHLAAQKLSTLQLYTKNLVVCSPRISDEVRRYPVRFLERNYSDDVLDGMGLVYACTDNRRVNRQIGNDARRRGILVNVADDPAACDFISPAIFKQGHMSVAVSSNGEDVKTSIAWRNTFKNFFERGDLPLTTPLKVYRGSEKKKRGKVWLVGFGPGDPKLMTFRAHHVLSGADVIYYDDLVDASVLKRYRARNEYVGKRAEFHSERQEAINQKLFRSARSGLKVARLKGGDPTIFGRGGEEIEYLRKRCIDVEVVPGVTAACAAAAAAGISLTHRGISREVVFRSGHGAPQMKAFGMPGTLVYYMVSARLADISRELREDGWSPRTPALLVHNVSLPGEHIVSSTLAGISRCRTTSPSILIIGQTARSFDPLIVRNTGHTRAKIFFR